LQKLFYFYYFIRVYPPELSYIEASDSNPPRRISEVETFSLFQQNSLLSADSNKLRVINYFSAFDPLPEDLEYNQDFHIGGLISHNFFR